MPAHNIDIIGLFCEDVREELHGLMTIVGVLPDNVAVQQVPFIFPKLGFYLRIHYPIEMEPETIHAHLVGPTGKVTPLGIASSELVAGAISETRGRQSSAGIIIKGVLAPVHISDFGQLALRVVVGGHERICGVLNIAPPSAPTASQPPSEQSPPAAPAS